MKKQKKLRGLQRRKAISGYLFIMPFILGFSMFMVKPFFQKKKSTIQAIDQIKQYYYERYKKYGLDKMEPWN